VAAEPDGWVTELQMYRAGKDEYFRTDPESPITVEARPEFRGLSYYPPDAALRFESVELVPQEPPRMVDMPATRGPTRRFLVAGTFSLRIATSTVRLTGYRLLGGLGTESLFLPFRDATSGQETYAGGRYLDLEPNGDGSHFIDFNRAYQPYCAYNPRFSCPIPPVENRVAVPIRAGERLLPGDHMRLGF
jgi:uncharacterized protein